MKIVHFGDYNPNYNRTHVIDKGMRVAGAEVIVVRTDTRGFRKYAELMRGLRRAGKVDAVVIANTDDRLLIVLAKLFSDAPVVFDMLYAMYDNWIEERKLASRHSPKAMYYWMIDWLATHIADGVIVENFAHADYFAHTYRVSRAKFIRVLVGTDDDAMKPLPREEDGKFRVEFHGKFFPMQGTHAIVRAASELMDDPDIVFTMIGGGQEFASTKALAQQLGATNVTLVPAVPFAELPKFIKDAHVTLGLLGDFPRTDRSMPNKLYETAAMSRLCINADTPAVREIFTDGVDVCLVPKGNAHALAEKIRWLKSHKEEQSKIEQNAYQTYLKFATPMQIGKQLLSDLQQHFQIS